MVCLQLYARAALVNNEREILIMHEEKAECFMNNFEFIVLPASVCIGKQIMNWKSLTLLICNLSSLHCKAQNMT